MKRLLIINLLLGFLIVFSPLQSCQKHMSLEKRKRVQAKRKKKHPFDCPQIDCD